MKKIKKDLVLNNTKASVPNIAKAFAFSPFPLGGVLGNAKLNNPSRMDTPAAT